MTEMFGEAWPPMSVPDLAPDDDDDDTNNLLSFDKGPIMDLNLRVMTEYWLLLIINMCLSIYLYNIFTVIFHNIVCYSVQQFGA